MGDCWRLTCPAHGSSARQVREKARARLDALVVPAIEGLRVALESGEVGAIVRASTAVLDRCGFAPSRHVSLELPEPTRVELHVIDAGDQELAELEDEVPL